MSVIDEAGQESFRTNERTMTGGKFDSPDVEILRDHLCQTRYESVGDRVRFEFGDRLASITQSEGGVEVEFASGQPPRRFDLVIGADGLYSGVRRLVFGPDSEFLCYLGQQIAVFSMPNFLELDHWEVLCMQGDVGGLM